MKIVLEQKKCIGCGACAALDPAHFKMKPDNSKAELLKPNRKNADDVFEEDVQEITTDSQDATDSCPVQCILLEK